MINISNPVNNVKFQGLKLSKTFIPAFGIMCCLAAAPAKGDTFVKTQDDIELIDTINLANNKTRLSDEKLANAPSPVITVAGKERKVGIVVDVSHNELYRYNNNGDVIDGYKVATGVIGRRGKSITGTGIRMVDHIETYPYKCAPGSKRARNPKAYGPKILYLTTIDPKTGADLGSNGEFIHGNNDASSIGKYASHGCMRMDNDVIKQFAKEVKPGTLVLIKE